MGFGEVFVRHKIVYTLCEKCPNTELFWSFLSRFRTYTEIYSVNLHIQSEYGKIWLRKNFVFGHLSRNGKQVEFLAAKYVL